MTSEKPRTDRSPNADFNDPDRQNSEQDEQGTQAQDVAQDALDGADPLPESEPGSPESAADLVPRDVPDLTEIQKAMLRSGRIDLSAFEGEEKMDDEDE